MSVLATCKPEPTGPDYDRYVCKRCGITRTVSKPNRKPAYCMDCIPHARAFGWAPPKRMPA